MHILNEELAISRISQLYYTKLKANIDDIDTSSFLDTQNRIYKIVSYDKRTLMEAGAKAAAAPTRDKQKAVFMLSIGIDRGEELAVDLLLVGKYNTLKILQ